MESGPLLSPLAARSSAHQTGRHDGRDEEEWPREKRPEHPETQRTFRADWRPSSAVRLSSPKPKPSQDCCSDAFHRQVNPADSKEGRPAIAKGIRHPCRLGARRNVRNGVMCGWSAFGGRLTPKLGRQWGGKRMLPLTSGSFILAIRIPDEAERLVDVVPFCFKIGQVRSKCRSPFGNKVALIAEVLELGECCCCCG